MFCSGALNTNKFELEIFFFRYNFFNAAQLYAGLVQVMMEFVCCCHAKASVSHDTRR